MMVDIAYIRRRAWECRAHTVGRAFCKALGIDAGRVEGGRSARRGKYREPRRFEVVECFRNFGSPMDGRV